MIQNSLIYQSNPRMKSVLKIWGKQTLPRIFIIYSTFLVMILTSRFCSKTQPGKGNLSKLMTLTSSKIWAE